MADPIAASFPIKKAYPERELLRLLPSVLRARDFHLYLENGKRLTDLWLQGGKAVLGHKAPRLLLELKNNAERGLLTPLPHPSERRLLKALEGFFPGRAFRLYRDSGSLNRALEEAGLSGNASIWRPFVEAPAFTEQTADEQTGEAPILIPVLPWPLGPELLVLGKSLEARFPAGELVPPVQLATAARALFNLSAALKSPGQGRMRFHRVEKVLRRQKPGAGLWRQRGIYLSVEPGMEKEKYKALFLRFLEGGFLLPPSPTEPVILPASMSEGEEVKLAELLRG